MSADKLLADAAQIMQERAKQYDSPTGERSMGKAVAAFNAVTGNKMTEAEGWLLLQLLKDVRQWTTPQVAHVDSLQDCIAYAALKAECIINQGFSLNSTEIAWEDKELPSSGIYQEPEGKEVFVPIDDGRVWVGEAQQFYSKHPPIDYGCTAGYSVEDLAASLVHDCELSPALVAYSNTTTQTDPDGWISHVGNECPVSDGELVLEVKLGAEDAGRFGFASKWYWGEDSCRITHWRYAR